MNTEFCEPCIVEGQFIGRDGIYAIDFPSGLPDAQQQALCCSISSPSEASIPNLQNRHSFGPQFIVCHMRLTIEIMNSGSVGGE
jgi:hypothetical protein